MPEAAAGDKKKGGKAAAVKDKEEGDGGEAQPVYVRKQFELVVPLLILTFLRQTGGVALDEKPPAKVRELLVHICLFSTFLVTVCLHHRRVAITGEEGVQGPSQL